MVLTAAVAVHKWPHTKRLLAVRHRCPSLGASDWVHGLLFPSSRFCISIQVHGNAKPTWRRSKGRSVESFNYRSNTPVNEFWVASEACKLMPWTHAQCPSSFYTTFSLERYQKTLQHLQIKYMCISGLLFTLTRLIRPIWIWRSIFACTGLCTTTRKIQPSSYINVPDKQIFFYTYQPFLISFSYHLPNGKIKIKIKLLCEAQTEMGPNVFRYYNCKVSSMQ